MRYAIISDIHANPEALQRVLSDAAKHGVENIVCLGDIVGYGPLPAEAIAAVRKSAAIAIAGNHDDAVSGRMKAADFIGLAGDAVSRHRASLSKGDIAYLKSLPHTASIDGAVVSHGDLADPERFRYIDSEQSAAENFAASDAQLAFVGHTHVPCIYIVGASKRIYRLGPEDFVLEDGKRYIVNVGSVGYPRESGGQCNSTYAIYDSTARSVVFRSIPFSVSSMLQRGAADRSRPLVIAAIAVAAIAVAGVAATSFLAANRRQSQPVPELPVADAANVAEPTAAEPRQRDSAPLAEKSVALPLGCRKVHANLSLVKGSAPALLKISFYAKDGGELPPTMQTVKAFSSKGFQAPAGAVRAKISVHRASESGAAPDIRLFAPSAK